MKQRFTPEQRIAIMNEYVTTKTEQKELAVKYGVCQTTISNAVLWASFDIMRLFHQLHEDKAECARRLSISETTIDAAYRKINT